MDNIIEGKRRLISIDIISPSKGELTGCWISTSDKKPFANLPFIPDKEIKFKEGIPLKKGDLIEFEMSKEGDLMLKLNGREQIVAVEEQK